MFALVQGFTVKMSPDDKFSVYPIMLHLYQPCKADSRPVHVAPFHPRLDVLMFYQGMGPEWSLTPELCEPYGYLLPSLMKRIAYLLMTDVKVQVQPVFNGLK